MRRIFFGSPSGSIKTAATTGIPDSTEPSLPVRQIRLALASWPLGHTLVQGEKVRFGGCSPCCGCPGAAPFGWLGGGLGVVAFGCCAFGAVGCCARPFAEKLTADIAAMANGTAVFTAATIMSRCFMMGCPPLAYHEPAGIHHAPWPLAS